MTQPDPTIQDPTIQEPGVLRRMLQARSQVRLGQGGASQLPPQPAPTLARAAATAISRTADRLYQLPVRALSVQPGAVTLAELPEMLPELPLVVVLQGPGDLLGAIALCPQAVAALVEWQALGRVTSRGLERRRPTRSDALLCAEFIDALLTDLTTEMKDVEGFDCSGGYHFLTHLDDPRPLSLMLEDRPFRSLSLHLGMGSSDMRKGQILLVLPQPATIAKRRPDPAPALPIPDLPPPARPSLAMTMQDAPVMVTGVLCRRKVSLAELRGFLDGRLMTLPRSSLTQATLETADGQILATGKLGEAEGCHAIRLRDPAQIASDDGAIAMSRPVIGAVHPPADLSQPDPFRAESPANHGAGMEVTVLRG